MLGRLNEVVVDCHNPAALARFWAIVLGGEPVHRDPTWSFLDPPDGQLRLAFQRVPEGKPAKNRLHLDVSVTDIDRAVHALAPYGGKPAGDEVADAHGAFRVVTDPEGNEFCLVSGQPSPSRTEHPARRVPAALPHRPLVLLPAVDVAGGQAVRLVQGEAGSETTYGDPLAAALAWQEAGAEWIHLVDLDAAFGRGSNRELLAEVVGRLDVDVELSGGIRDDESLRAALATGCARVNIGTAALESPDWVRDAIAEYGDRIAVGLDVRGTTLAARGWTEEGGELFDVLLRLDRDGCARYVVTDVQRDGTLTGPNLGLLHDVCAVTDRPVVASGGVSTLEDLRALAGLVPIGVEGAIVGKALYAGAFTLQEALAAVAQPATL